MGFEDDFAAAAVPEQVKCSICQALSDMDPELRAFVNAKLADGMVQAPQIARFLASKGHDVKPAALRTHRRGHPTRVRQA